MVAVEVCKGNAESAPIVAEGSAPVHRIGASAQNTNMTLVTKVSHLWPL